MAVYATMRSPLKTIRILSNLVLPGASRSVQTPDRPLDPSADTRYINFAEGNLSGRSEQAQSSDLRLFRMKEAQRAETGAVM